MSGTTPYLEAAFLVETMVLGPVAGGIGDAGLIADDSVINGDLVTVTHFTNADTAAAIGEGGYLNPGSFVTTDDLSGLSASEVESTLEISPGKGAFSSTFQTPVSNLGPAYNGPLTSGGAVQFQVINPTQITTFVPSP